MISGYLVNLLGLSLFLYVGLESAYGGWISSYAVLTGIYSKEQATIFPSIYWVSITALRLGMAFIKMGSADKLKCLLNINITTSIISVILVKAFGMISLACYFSSVLLGIAYSSMYPLILTLPTELNLDMLSSQTTKIITFAAMSEGILSMAVGYSMEMISIDWLFYSLGIITVLYWVTMKMAFTQLTL